MSLDGQHNAHVTDHVSDNAFLGVVTDG